jgi:phasin family protein
MSPKAQASEAFAAGKEAVEQVVASSSAAATRSIEQAQVAVTQQLNTAAQHASGVFKSVEDAVEFGRGNIEAMVKANQILVAGLTDISRTAFANVQATMEESLANARALAGVKSVKEAIDLQGAFVRSAFEKTFATAVATQERSVKLVETAFAPVADRAKVAMETLSRPLAA